MKRLTPRRLASKHVVALAIMAAFTSAALLPGCTPDTSKGQALVAERCTRCHPQSQAESGQRSADEWANVVDTMIARGAQLDPTERQQVIDYLSNR